MRPELDDAGLRLYLLGLLPEAEAETLEEAYLARPEVWERVRGVEDDLLDDYAAGRLGPPEHAAFESRYLASPPLRERVVAARALRLASGRSQVSSFRVPALRAVTARLIRWGGPVAIAASLLLALAIWSRPPRPRQVTSASASPTSDARPEMPPPRPSVPTASLPSPAPPPVRRQPPTRPIVLALSPVLLRGQERPTELRIPKGTDTVVLELEGDPATLPASASAVEAVVETVEGGPVWRGEARRATAAKPSLIASARVPAARLVAGDYLLTLSTRGSAGGTLYRYFFRVSP